MAEAPATIGLAPHSGWAALVALSGPKTAPRVLLRVRLEMTSPKLAGPKQPYHEVERLPVAQAARLLERYLANATTLAEGGLRASVDGLKAQGFSASSVTILQSNGRQGASLEAILASHALIHTADGDHFRDALAEAARRCGIPSSRVKQRELLDRTSAALKQPPGQLQSRVAGFGKAVGPPWNADQKQAALLAWLALAGAR